MKRQGHPKPSPIDFDLRQLEIFRNVVELGSFSKAAEAVFLAQASVSERIATLENAVGTRLLDRLGRQVTPTRAGELLYKHAMLLLDMKRTAVLEMRDFLGQRQGEIQMGGSTIPGEYILPAMVARFQMEYPRVSVMLNVADTAMIQTRVLAGEFELGVVGSKSRHPHLITRELWQDELVLAFPSQHPWAQGEEITIEQLRKEPFILRETGSGTLSITETYLHKGGLRDMDSLRVVARLGTSTAVKEGIKAGLGVSILSSRALQTELETGLVKTGRIRGLRMLRSFFVIRDRRRVPSPLCQAMLDFLRTTSEESHPCP